MASRLRPEVILPLRTGSAWARTLLLSCCAFIMFVTTVDAMRYAAQRDRVPVKPRAFIQQPAASRHLIADTLREVDKTAARLRELTKSPATSPRPR